MSGEDRCVCCGAVIPEGRHVCPICETAANTGIRCPGCGVSGYVQVMQTINMPGYIRRRRKCGRCGKTFYTRERAE